MADADAPTTAINTLDPTHGSGAKTRRLATLKRIKSFCGAKPPRKLGWTNAGRWGPGRYGDFSWDARCLGC